MYVRGLIPVSGSVCRQRESPGATLPVVPQSPPLLLPGGAGRLEGMGGDHRRHSFIRESLYVCLMTKNSLQKTFVNCVKAILAERRFTITARVSVKNTFVVSCCPHLKICEYFSLKFTKNISSSQFNSLLQPALSYQRR